MDVHALRQNLLQRLGEVNSESILKILSAKLDSLLANEADSNWWHELSDAERNYLERSMEQGRKGETVSSEEVHRIIDDLLKD